MAIAYEDFMNIYYRYQAGIATDAEIQTLIQAGADTVAELALELHNDPHHE